MKRKKKGRRSNQLLFTKSIVIYLLHYFFFPFGLWNPLPLYCDFRSMWYSWKYSRGQSDSHIDGQSEEKEKEDDHQQSKKLMLKLKTMAVIWDALSYGHNEKKKLLPQYLRTWWATQRNLLKTIQIMSALFDIDNPLVQLHQQQQ